MDKEAKPALAPLTFWLWNRAWIPGLKAHG